MVTTPLVGLAVAEQAAAADKAADRARPVTLVTTPLVGMGALTTKWALVRIRGTTMMGALTRGTKLSVQ